MTVRIRLLSQRNPGLTEQWLMMYYGDLFSIVGIYSYHWDVDATAENFPPNADLNAFAAKLQRYCGGEVHVDELKASSKAA